ncbi:hypothetical protein M431DRAFT_482429 [Trichoderma harzianum CBS 226.95]|uniref:Uncharacterized protein n=1 Tax=Trichoderma harzianum CBS 226.95 TaxID=983964 RepID=A0A2T4A8Z7_TRIHA|nr:hypothetical protein M431DRAFT_482429 [Trichoderma harzianum CBS 226.95]PTB53549.1 hypothetical protein M431DRAFT_482429 [Trichoderma harzianum CBS 226.95]
MRNPTLRTNTSTPTVLTPLHYSSIPFNRRKLQNSPSFIMRIFSLNWLKATFEITALHRLEIAVYSRTISATCLPRRIDTVKRLRYNGYSDGITVPSTKAQAASVQRTYKNGGLDPENNIYDYI